MRSIRSRVFLALLALSVVVGVARAGAAGPPSPVLGATAGSTVTEAVSPAAPQVVLYSQYDNPGTVATSSQNFEAVNDAEDDELADDFVVPGGQTWSITTVVALGVYYNGTGPAVSFNVAFYANSTSLPGATAATRSSQAYTSSGNDFTITLSPAVVLTAGTYWVSVQANMDFTPAGQWGWTNRTVQANSAAAWRNPNNGFATGCTSFGNRATCTSSPGGEPDQVFRLEGSSNPTAVGVSRLGASVRRNGVLVRWRTASEAEILGFNVWRYRGTKGVKVNRTLIHAKRSGEAAGAGYRFVDRVPGAKRGLTYRLQLVDLNGKRSWYAAFAVAS